MLEMWYLFPVAILISTLAMMAGIGGAVMFSPIFMLVLKLEPLHALAASLFIELFGFGSGFIGYLRKKAINFKLARKLAVFSLPATVIGIALGRFVTSQLLKGVLGCLLFYLSYQFLVKKKTCLPKDPRCTGVPDVLRSSLVTQEDKTLSLFGGLLLGLVSSGLGEINEYVFLKKMNLDVRQASGTSVYLVTLSALTGVLVHSYFLFSEGFSSVAQIFSILIFSIPGVLVGSQIGVALSGKISDDRMGRVVGVLFGILAVITLYMVVSA